MPIYGLFSMNSTSFLASCVRAAKRADRTDLFETPAMEVILRFKWQRYAKWVFLTLCLLSVLLAFNFSAFTYYGFRSKESSYRRLWEALLLVNVAPLVLIELLQLRQRKLAAEYVSGDGWNLFDISSYSLLILSVIVHEGASASISSSASTIISAALALLLWFKLLYYFRGFQETGILVRTVLQIAIDTSC